MKISDMIRTTKKPSMYSRSRYSRSRIIIKLFILFLILICFIYPGAYISTKEYVSVTIKYKERIVEGSGNNARSKYLVFTESEVFENTDSWLFGKFNSSDIQGRLEPNHTYKIKVSGWRIPFFSSYRNIIAIGEE